MGHPPSGQEKEVTTCDECGDTLVIPPGVYYRGQKLHKFCAKSRMWNDFSEEQYAPFLDQIEEDLSKLFENMGPMT